MSKLGYNKVYDIRDLFDPDLLKVFNDVFAYDGERIVKQIHSGNFDRKHWEIAMSVRALRDFGTFHNDSMILGIGAGTEITSFYLTKHVRMVYATDLYSDDGEWASYAPESMLYTPEDHAPFPYREDHLTVQYMDGCKLAYPDNMFDGIYSSGSIEHFGSIDAVRLAAKEAGRVLKPGGILTLSTEYKIEGAGDGWSPENTLILSQERIQDAIVDASMLELVDEIDFTLSEETLLAQRELSTLIRDGCDNHPNVVISHQGYVFCSIHLTLRKAL